MTARDREHKDWDRLRSQIVVRRYALTLTQQQVADDAGILRADLSKIENGERIPGAVVLAKVLRALGLVLAGVPE